MNWNKQSSISKKKTKLSPGPQTITRISNLKSKIKTENSPPRSFSKQQIKNTIKKIVYNQNNYTSMNKSTKNSIHNKQQTRKSRKLRSHLEISIPNMQTSLTPKNSHQNKLGQRQVQSTKAADSKLFNSSGRYDLKQIFQQRNKQVDPKNKSYGKDSLKIKQSPGIVRRDNDSKLHRQYLQKNPKEEQFDPKNVLTPQQYEKFGDRFPQKFKRLALLGRGGFSVVWLGIHKSTKRKFAIKQILTKNPHQTHLKEIWFGSYYFDKGGQARQQFENHIGINNICRLYSYEINNFDSWLYYQICEESLGSSLFQLKGQNHNNQRIYRIHYKELTHKIRENITELKILIIQIAKALHLINSHNIVHSDLKTQNILIKINRRNPSEPFIQDLKLIDFGSSFLFTNLKQFSMATPEYMPPQILNYILFQNKLQYDVLMLNKMQKYKNPWVVDIWSLGCIVLEIISGIPLWMSLPTKVQQSNKKAVGLFAVKGRLFNKIIAKQIETVQNLQQNLITHNYSGIKIDKQISCVLEKMLNLNPDERISPLQVLNYFGVACRPQKIPSY